MAEIILIKDWVSGQGKELKSGDKIDICRETYDKLIEEGICEPLKNEWGKKPKKKTKKTEPKKDK